MKKSNRIPWAVLGWLLFFCILSPVHPARAMDNPAGKILRLEGSAVIVRQGKTLPAQAEAKIFQSDEIKTGPDSLVELLLLDGSSLHLGPDSSLELTFYKFSLLADDPGFMCKMINGVFVYISGAISKLRPDAVKFETPDGTVAIRGTKLVVQVIAPDPESGAPGRTVLVLFQDPTGRVGQVIVINSLGQSTLDKEFYSVTVIRGTIPSEPILMSREMLELMIPGILHQIVLENYQPPLAYTEAFEAIIDPGIVILFPAITQPFSVSSP